MLKATVRIFATTFLVGLSALVLEPHPIAHAGSSGTKVTICHRTHSTTNPYRRITVAQSSIKGGTSSKHGNANGAHNLFSTGKFGVSPSPNPPEPNVFDSTFSYSPSDKKWGDIVPPTDVSGVDISGFDNLNYVGDGIKIYNGTDGTLGQCKKMTATEFALSEQAAGVSESDIMDDLEEQEANEDNVVKVALGGTFRGKTISNLTSAVDVTTDEPTNVTSTAARLNGNFKLGSAVVDTSFVWGTESTCETGTSVTAVASTATGDQSVTADLTGLTPGTTYYYKVVGTSDAGLETEGVIEGACVSFTVPLTDNPGGYGGALRGAVWIDFDRDGKWDSNEPSLPQTPLVAELTEAAVLSAQSVRSSVRTQGTTIRLTTDSAGRFSVGSLTPGKWRVKALLTTEALETVYDSGGQLDWTLDAVVPLNGVGVGTFAAAGNTTILNSPVPSGTTQVNVRWEGADKKFNTLDDVLFTLKVSNGRIQAEGLPSGRFRFVLESATGSKVVFATLEWATYRLEVSNGSFVLVQLAETGTSSLAASALALMSILVGVLFVGVRRLGRLRGTTTGSTGRFPDA